MGDPHHHEHTGQVGRQCSGGLNQKAGSHVRGGGHYAAPRRSPYRSYPQIPLAPALGTFRSLPDQGTNPIA